MTTDDTNRCNGTKPDGQRCDMTPDPAVRAAAEALASHYGDTGYAALHEDDATVAVAAARPIIEAEVTREFSMAAIARDSKVYKRLRDAWEAELRERIAAEIEATSAPDGTCTDYRSGLDHAARIARGGAS